jgi:lysozyme family protein
MARFEDAIEVILAHEGGYCCNPADAGGATNWGISSRFLATHGLNIDPKTMTRESAVNLYRMFFWSTIYDQIQDQTLATKIFDMAVNMGPSRAHQILQSALNFLGETLGVDGQIGRLTMAAIARHAPDYIVRAIKGKQADFYRSLVEKNPSQGVFLKGWLRRASWPDDVGPTPQ